MQFSLSVLKRVLKDEIMILLRKNTQVAVLP